METYFVQENNIIALFFAILPIAIYALTLFFVTPPKFISISRAKKYFVGGLLTTSMIIAWSFLFPFWGGYLMASSLTIILFVKYFIQVGLLEELCKYVCFLWVSTMRKGKHMHDMPIATIFYCVMTACGFALCENIVYLMNYPYMMITILLERAITSTFVHITCGVIVGYILSRSNVLSLIMHTEKEADELTRRKLYVKKYLHIISAIFFAATYHGYYNYAICTTQNDNKLSTAIAIATFGIIISCLIIDKAIKESKQIYKTKNSTPDNEL